MQMVHLTRLKQTRNKQGKSAQDIAVIARCSLSSIYKAEIKPIGMKLAEDIAKALKVKVDDLR